MAPNEVSYTVVSISVFERFCVDDKPIKKSVRKRSGVDTGGGGGVWISENKPKTLSKIFWFVFIETKKDTLKSA